VECYLQDYSYGLRPQRKPVLKKIRSRTRKKDVGENNLLYSDRCIM
jgi:hypothetical protein